MSVSVIIHEGMHGYAICGAGGEKDRTARLRIGQNCRAVCTKKRRSSLQGSGLVRTVRAVCTKKFMPQAIELARDAVANCRTIGAKAPRVSARGLSLYLSVDSVWLSQLRHSASCKIVAIKFI